MKYLQTMVFNSSTVTVTNLALHMSETKCGLDQCAPTLGQDNERVYKALGYSEAQIKELAEAGII